MAKELQASLGVTGLTVTATTYLNGVAVTTGISCPEVGSSGLYAGNMVGVAGHYTVQFFYGGVARGAGEIDWNGTSAITLTTINNSISGLIGSNTVTITVVDGSADPIPNARVSVHLAGVQLTVGLTDINGEKEFGLDNGVGYEFVVTSGGFTSQVITGYTVPDDDPDPVVLTPLAITPSDPTFTTGFFIARDENNNPVEDVSFELTFIAPPDGDTGTHYDGVNSRTVTSGSDGLVSFANTVPGSQYSITADDGTEMLFIAGDSDPYEIPSFK